MAVPVLMPKLGLTMEEGTVVAWLKQEGDRVEPSDVLLEISTEKVTAEVEAPRAGILRGLRARAGEAVRVGQPVAFIAEPDEPWDARLPASGQQRPAAAQLPSAETTPVAVPPIRPPVQAVSATPLAVRIAADYGIDLSQVPPSGLAGQITKRDVETYRMRQPLRSEATMPQSLPALATPIVKRLAQEIGVDIRLVQGSGPGGLIIERDFKAFLAGRRGDAGHSSVSAVPVREALALSGRRKIIAERMAQSARQAPHIQVSLDIEMGAAQARRGTASLTAFLGWIAAQTLLDHPRLNAALEGNQIRIFDTVNLGVAVDTDEGLIVPVIHGAHRLSLQEVDEAVQELAQLARSGRLSLDHVSAGTFTFSNLGMLGIDSFEAILNPPQAAILATGQVRLRPWARDAETVTIVPVMTATLAVDHRVVDGAAAARFLADFARRLA